MSKEEGAWLTAGPSGSKARKAKGRQAPGGLNRERSSTAAGGRDQPPKPAGPRLADIRKAWYRDGKCTGCGEPGHIRAVCPTNPAKAKAAVPAPAGPVGAAGSGGIPPATRAVVPTTKAAVPASAGAPAGPSETKAALLKKKRARSGGKSGLTPEEKRPKPGASAAELGPPPSSVWKPRQLHVRDKDKKPLSAKECEEMRAAFHAHVFACLEKGRHVPEVEEWTFHSDSVRIKVPGPRDAQVVKEGLTAKGYSVMEEAEYLATMEPLQCYIGRAKGTTAGMTARAWELLVAHQKRRMGIATVMAIKRLISMDSGMKVEIEMDSRAEEEFRKHEFSMRLAGFGRVRFEPKSRRQPNPNIDERLRANRQKVLALTNQLLRLRQEGEDLQDEQEGLAGDPSLAVGSLTVKDGPAESVKALEAGEVAAVPAPTDQAPAEVQMVDGEPVPSTSWASAQDLTAPQSTVVGTATPQREAAEEPESSPTTS